MNPIVFPVILTLYFALLYFISKRQSKDAKFDDFYNAGKQAPWFIVAFGMIGASLSGVTFISIPGWVGERSLSYMQMVFGYFLGYIIIAQVLLPLYYKMELQSIYVFLRERLGVMGHKTGAFYFILSRSIGASFRLFLVAIVLQKFAFDQLGIPFALTVGLTILMIWLYTYQSGIKTIIWTDTLQTGVMLLVLFMVLSKLSGLLDISILELPQVVLSSDYGQVFFFENAWTDPMNFFKQVLAGMFITIVMTGLDQDMMQKNLSCKSISDAKKNMLSFSVLLIFINFLFLVLGVLLFIYMDQVGMDVPTRMVNGELKTATDLIFPTIAIEHLGPVIGVLFFIGLIAAAYSSADSALTALTTSFCIDFLGMSGKMEEGQKVSKKTRLWVHIAFSILLFVIINVFYWINDDAVISSLFKVAGYTYGPLLGMFSYSLLFSNARLRYNWIPIIAVLSPVLTYFINQNSEKWLNGYKFDFELLILNGLLCFIGLLVITRKFDKNSN